MNSKRSAIMATELNLSSSHQVWDNHKVAAVELNHTNISESPSISASLFNDVMGIWITGLFCVLGIAGNVLSFIVLLRAFGRSPMFYVLRAVSVADALFLITVLMNNTVVNMYPHTGVLEWCYTYRGYIQFSLWPIMMMMQMSTVWLTLLVSLERYVAICFPLKAASVCTITKVRKAVITIYIVSILYNVPRYFEYEVVGEEGNIVKTLIGSHMVYRYLYTCVLYSLMLFFIPLLALIFLNLKLVLALRAGKKQWQSLQFRQKKEQNLTIIPLTIVLIFFICGTPSLAVNVIESINPDVFGNSRFITFMVVSNMLVVLNSALNFVIYCLLGKKFRTKLVELFRCKCGGSYRVVHHLVNNTQVSGYDHH